MLDERFQDLFAAAQSRRLSRRAVLKRATALGLSAPVIAGLLAACGGDDDDADPTNTSGATDEPTATSGTGGAATEAPDDEATEAPDGSPTSEATESTDGEPTATTADEGGERGGGGMLRILWWQAPTVLNGHLSVAGKDIGAIHICMEPLAQFGPDGELVPILAAEIPSVENGSVAEDQSSVTWTLRQGVKWHDGEDFTADDVAFTFEYLSDPLSNATTLGFYSDVESVEAIDDYIVQVNFKNPIAAWFNPFVGSSGTILPEHVLRDFIGEPAANAPFNLMPVGTGPYKVSNFVPGDTVLYEIHQDYWAPGKPYFDQVEFKGGGDAASAARAVLQSGEADWAWNLQVESQILESLKDAGAGTLVTWSGAGTEKLLFNHSDPETEQDGQRSHRDVPHPHFQDLRVRQAVALAIPRGDIAEQLYGDAGTATGYTMNESPAFMPEGITWEFDLDQANALLDEAGAARGSDGIRELNGRKLSWISSASINSVRQKEQEIIKQSFGELGVELEIAAVDASAYFDAGNIASFQHLYYDFGIERNAAQIYPLLWYRRYLSTDPLKDIAQQENGWAGRNIQRYQNDEFNALYQQAATETDPEVYTEIFLDMQRHVVENQADIGMVSCNNVAAASTDLSGYNPSPYAVEVWDIRDWRKG
ncbi:MAG TPA: peptide ABC transporter substrate-binding protein [Thermomicrobiales bacterium]|nr:peptide ABC transporter substrate-binding protein [Thermomicrobiales bacterium]